MCMWRCVPVGSSKAPMATAIFSLCTGSQNRDEPHVLQKPRRTRPLDWVPGQGILALDGESRLRHVGRSEIMAGVLAALHAMAGVAARQLHVDVEAHRAAEAGAARHQRRIMPLRGTGSPNVSA